jgi:hypothetical protein
MPSTLPIVLVTCAAGHTGREVVKQLGATGKFHVRAGMKERRIEGREQED